ncbi:MAG: RHS repeat protein, partial [Phycisphaerae bacterium]|nr:RHS repeat protein [Phycisphaerae bacterium]
MNFVHPFVKQFSKIVLCVLTIGIPVLFPQRALGQVPTPPMYNDRTGSPPFCEYAAQGSPCSTDCRCVPTISSTGWPCDGCPGSTPSGWWPGFATLFYPHSGAGSCAPFDFHQLPLVNFPSGVLQAGNLGLIPNYTISLSSIGGLGRIRDVPLESSPDRFPTDAAARFQLVLGGTGSSADCRGAVFFVTAEFNPSLFDVTVFGRVRTGGSFNCGSTPLQPFQPRLIVGTEISTSNDLRYPDLIASPHYIKIGMKPGRSTRDAGSESVKLRVHRFNWGGDHDFFCEASGNCPEGFRFQQSASTNVQVFSASYELPVSWCADAPPLSDEDKLPISTLSDEQRQAAEFDGQGAKTLNDLTAELPSLRVGHNRFRCGRTLQESLGNDAYWHNGFSCSASVFARVNLFGVWCAVEDLPGWTYQQVGSEFVVTDPNEGLTYHYQRPGGGTNLSETPLKLASIKRSGSAIRTFAYSGGGVSGNLTDQTDNGGDAISYTYGTQGSDTLLTVTGTEVGGGSRVITALYSSAGFLKSATWANGGPARQYEYIVDLVNPALDGRINRVLDAAGNLLLDYDYDSTGRVVLTTRGTGPTLQTLNRQVHETPPTSSNQTVGDTWMISQCFVDATTYQA